MRAMLMPSISPTGPFQQQTERNRPPTQVIAQTLRNVIRGGQIADLFMPRLIGFSTEDLRRFGKPDFYDGKEWAASWRFVFRRDIIMEHGVRFPVGVTMSEDRFFNIEYLCHAQKLLVIEDKLYTYYQNPQSLIARLDDPMKTLTDKVTGITERMRLREIYQKETGRDIFGLFSGTLVLSCFELYTKLCRVGFAKGWNALRDYCARPEIKEAFSRTSLQNLPLKIMLPIAIHKYHLGFAMFAGLWLLHKIKH